MLARFAFGLEVFMKDIDYWLYLVLSLSKIYLFSVFTASAFNFNFFVINLAGILVLTSWSLVLKPKVRRWILLASLFLHSTLLISDTWYYRYFEDLLSISLLSDIGQMGDVGGGFMTLIEAKDFLFFGDLLLFAFLIFFTRNKADNTPLRNRRMWAGSVTALGLVLFIAPLASSYANEEDWLVEGSISNMREYYQLGFWGYHGADVAKGIAAATGFGEEITQAEKLEIETLKPEEPVAASAKQPNVIMVQLESFQTSVIDQQINEQEVTPNLNALKQEMLYFPSFYHQTHEGRTSDAEFITNSSLHPVKSGSVYTQYADNEFEALPGLLKKAGYETAAMHAFEKDFWNRDDFYKNIGFNQFFSKKDFPDDGVIGMALNDKEFFSTSVSLMEDLPEPYYAFMVALTSHTPYDIPDEEKRLDLTGYEDELLQNYYHTVHYVDAAIGLMVEDLKKKDMWDDALVVFYGDHDSGLNAPEAELAQKAGAETAADAFRLDRQVPLFIKPPNLKKGEVVQAGGGQIDIAPTILDLLNMKPAYMLGHSLLDEEPNITVFRNGAFQYEDVYYKPDLTQTAGEGICYSLETGSPTNFADCEKGIEQAAEQLRLSDTIIERNALETIE